MASVWKVEKIPILQDNFVFVLHKDSNAWVVDPGDDTPIIDFLKEKQLVCAGILITHHHHDHIDGIAKLVQEYACPVYAPEKNRNQIPHATHLVHEGDKLTLQDLNVEVLELPGHTLGHIAYWIPAKKWLFSGDVLFALGCGRLFEGSFEQMYQSLARLKSLPPETLVFCTHDYYASNKDFCDRQNLNIQDYDPIHPLLLAQELQFNPFLNADSLEQFTDRRTKRNQ